MAASFQEKAFLVCPEMLSRLPWQIDLVSDVRRSEGYWLAFGVLQKIGRQNMDSRKNIAVYLPQIYTEFVVRLRNGIEEEAAKRGFHLIFFTSLVDNASFGSTGHENENYNEGERAIFYLADFDKVDALIVLYDAFANTHWQDLFDIIYERCHCPVINIRTPLDGVYNILMDDDISFANMIQHFIDVHKVHRLNLVTGPEENVHARMRLDIYKKVLEKNQIPYEKERVYYGNFWRNCGEGAIQAFLDCGDHLRQRLYGNVCDPGPGRNRIYGAGGCDGIRL